MGAVPKCMSLLEDEKICAVEDSQAEKMTGYPLPKVKNEICF